MDDHDFSRRLRDAGHALLGLRGALVAGEPWPLSSNWGTEPEAQWGPREVLAHVNEMLPYWTGQLSGVLEGDPATAVPFGRVATDTDRLSRIETDRERPTGQLLDEIDGGLHGAETFLGGLGDGDLERRGLHPTRGELTLGEAFERFIVGHLQDHLQPL